MSRSMFTSIMEIKSTMTMKGIIGPRPYKEIEVYSIPIGIDRGHHCPGALVYKTVDDKLVMYSESRNIFFPLMIQQFDDIETTDGRQFCFADDGDYGVLNCKMPAGIRRNNMYLKELGVVEWSESLHFEWFEEPREANKYQWNPYIDAVRRVYRNGSYSTWCAIYTINSSHNVKFVIKNPFDEYSGLIEWAVNQDEEAEDNYGDVAERYERWEGLRKWAMQQPDEEDKYEDVAAEYEEIERHARWEGLRQWALTQDTSEYPEEWCIATNERLSEKAMEARRIKEFINSSEFTDVDKAWKLFEVISDDFDTHKLVLDGDELVSAYVYIDRLGLGTLFIHYDDKCYCYKKYSRKWIYGAPFLTFYNGTPSKEAYEKITTFISTELMDKYSKYI